MKEEATATVYRRKYSPPVYRVSEVDLDISLYEEETFVSCRIKVRAEGNKDCSRTPLVLNGEELELLEIKLDGDLLDRNEFVHDSESLTISKVPDSFLLETKVRIHPEKNTSLEGLYRSGSLFCTQCEAEGFRRITFFPDRPDVMACYRTRIEADAEHYPVLLSNGNPTGSGILENGRHWQVWEDPFPKPSYLFAMVAGELECLEDRYTTVSGREVTLRIYVEPGNLERSRHAMRSLKKSMEWDEQHFGREYDLDLFMIVAVEDFNAGAMENKGLNIFNSRLVLASPETATDRDYSLVQGVIAHEYFHNWTGNRVTCRDWFQLSLKEGLTVFRDQEFSADMNSRAVKRISDVNVLRTLQFPEDAGPMSHPVRPDSYQEINNFYTLTVYEKGAEVIRMMHTLLGEEGFRKGMDLYFERHDGQAVTCEDFVSALEDANVFSLKQFRHWYGQSGTPSLEVIGHYEQDRKTYRLTVLQSCPDTPGQKGFTAYSEPDTGKNDPTSTEILQKKPFHLPLKIGLLDPEGNPMPLRMQGEEQIPASVSRTLEIRETKQNFVFEKIEKPPIPSLLRHFSAPVELVFDYSDEDLGFLFAHDTDEFNRWEVCQRLMVRTFLSQIASIREQRALLLPETLLKAFRIQLQKSETADPSLLAQTLSFPGEGYLGEKMEVIDVGAVRQARQFLLRELALCLNEEFNELYQRMKDPGPFRTDPKAMGRRKLKNLCLDYLVRSEKIKARERAAFQFENSSNMTDTIGALTALNDCEGVERENVMADFEKQWMDEPLVLDKWFSLQATCSLPGTLERIQKLTMHPHFNPNNPNRIRSLIGAFSHGNPICFHAASGEGYGFLADSVLVCDRRNPMVAARLVSAFSRWRKYDAGRQALIQKELERIAADSDLSGDVREIVSKTLQASASRTDHGV